MGERIVVTGAAGRIGSVVARRLARDGYDLVLLDRAPAKNVPDGATYIECDLHDRDRVLAATAGAAVIIHLGEIPALGIGFTDEQVFESNTTACRTMLDAAVAAGARRFIYTSSCQRYGYWGSSDFDKSRPPSRWPIDETLPAAPRGAYAESKAANEAACQQTSDAAGLDVFMFRFPWVVPEWFEVTRERWEKADRNALDGFWTYVHVEDAAEAYTLAVARDRPLEPLPSRCEAFHFVADDVRGILPIREKLERFLPAWPPLPADWPARKPPVSCEKAARYLGWRPMIRLADRLGLS